MLGVLLADRCRAHPGPRRRRNRRARHRARSPAGRRRPSRLEGVVSPAGAGGGPAGLSLAARAALARRSARWNDRSAVGGTGHPLLGERLAAPEPAWECDVEPDRVPWVGDHTIGQTGVMPAAAFAEMALAAGVQAVDAPVEAIGLHIDTALALPWNDDAMDVRLRTSLSPDDGITRISSTDGAGSTWQEHARAQVRRLLRPRPDPLDLAVRAPGQADDGEQTAKDHYAYLSECGLAYGPRLRVLRDLRTTESTARARYTLPPSVGATYHAHPVVMDAALQAALALMPRDGRVYLPVSAEAVRCWQTPDTIGGVEVRARAITSGEGVVDITITDSHGSVTVTMSEVRMKTLEAHHRRPTEFYTTELRAVPLAGTPAPPFTAA
ncbi:hypothetical protein E1264_37705 [Actinomadura sp. KC216]|nr:hypothetical protein E1264_37705 [Actinomadura sp. KC216]